MENIIAADTAETQDTENPADALYCYHCGKNITSTENHFTVTLAGLKHPVCSTVCKESALWIFRIGLSDFGKKQEAGKQSVGTQKKSNKDIWQAPELLQHVVRTLPSGQKEVCLLVDGVRCNGCVLLIERTLTAINGVSVAQVNALSRRSRIVFDDRKTSLTELIHQLQQAGYPSHPLNAQSLNDVRRDEARDLLKRLLVAGFGMMQTMMFAYIIYFGPAEEIQGATLELFSWLGFLVATPVVLYSGQSFFKGAIQGLKNRQLNMDIPLAIAIGAVYLAGLYQTMQDSAGVYFDSITMLIFFLLTGRFIEMKTRHRSIDTIDALTHLSPEIAQRKTADGSLETISVSQLQRGDVLFITEGGHIPADGILLSPHAQIDESLLSGEARTQIKNRDDKLVAGSLVIGAAIEMRVSEYGDDTFLAAITRLVNLAQTQRPRLALAGQAAVSRFVYYVLGISFVTSIAWLLISPTQAMDATIAVLVVACPCAFALAVPAAITRSLSVLAKHGVLVINADAIEKLSLFDYVLFDKTGTLTTPSVKVKSLTDGWSAEQALQMAASLAKNSSHPLSRAVLSTNTQPCLPLQEVHLQNGMGLTGSYKGHSYHLGRADFATTDGNKEVADLILAQDKQLIASFEIDEQVRPDAAACIAQLKAQGLRCEISSGDATKRVEAIARQVGIEQWQARQLPADKLARIKNLQQQGFKVLVLGDGSNDAPVLAGADISVALASGTDLAQAQADIVLCSAQLCSLTQARATAFHTMHILKQNQNWALFYNVTAIPFAAFGMVSPLLAAIGMSASSLLVVLNALRIGTKKPQTLVKAEETVLA